MKRLNGFDAVDPSDVSIINGQDYVTPAGLVKMIAMSAFHHQRGSPEKALAEHTLEKLLDAAIRKGFSRSNELRTAFALTMPPSHRAKLLANDLADCFEGMELYEAIGTTVKVH